MLLAWIFDVAFAVALLGFLLLHARMVLRNCTTIEMFEKSRVIPWPYDRGWRRNFQEVFGRRCAIPFDLPLKANHPSRRPAPSHAQTVISPLLMFSAVQLACAACGGGSALAIQPWKAGRCWSLLWGTLAKMCHSQSARVMVSSQLPTAQ